MEHQIFAEMEARQDGFWGLAMHAEAETANFGRIPAHIQSFFMVVQKNMLHSAGFKKYWEELPYFANFGEVVDGHETKFTEHFGDMGFSYSTLADTGSNDSCTNRANNYMQYGMISYELIKKEISRS